MNKSQERWIPEGSAKITLKGADTVVYAQRVGEKIRGIGYAGKAVKPTFHYWFRSNERFSQYLAQFQRDRVESLSDKAARKAAKKAFVHSLNVGDVLRSSWGYDQTNVDFYEVVRVAGKQVEIREIAKQYTETGFLSGSSIPFPGRYKSGVSRHTVGEGNRVKVRSCATAYKFEPRIIGGVKVFDASHESHYA